MKGNRFIAASTVAILWSLSAGRARLTDRIETKPFKAVLPFVGHVVASDLLSGYHVAVADLNHDGRPDVIALAAGGGSLVWYENPTWERHVLISDLPHMINCAPGDPGRDGIPDIVVAWEFSNDASKSVGKVGVLRHNGDPRQAWTLRQIDEIPTSHRIRWADVDGSGIKVAVNAALTGPHAAPPDYAGDHPPLVLYRPGTWKRELISDENEGVQHGLLVTRWDRNDQRDSILTASFSGIHLYQFGPDQAGQPKWSRTEIARGDPSPCPKCGSSDVALGHLGNMKFVAAIEPWHGNQVAIYSPKGAAWGRKVIDDSLVDGHTILTADFDGDGLDEVAVGLRQGAKSVFLYRANQAGDWTKQVLDPGDMPGSTCVAADLNADGAIDLVCIGGTSVKWYENLTHPAKPFGK
jgi:FG-GAP-like repeat/FG-GAP repeat